MTKDLKFLLENEYKSCMYEDSPHDHLRAGDIVELSINDFKKIIRHESMISLFRDFEKNPDYESHLWAILNKNCDMVHDEEKSRYFSNNLFLAPLQGLISVLRKGTLGKNILYSKEIKSAEKTFIEAYEKYFLKNAKLDNPKREDESDGSYDKRIRSEVVDRTIKEIKNMIPSSTHRDSQPHDLLESIEQEAPEPICKDLNDFKNSEIWKDALKKFKESYFKKRQIEENIVLSKSAEKRITSLVLNQLDSEGIFYYEPSIHISDEKRDISYLIQIEDMITIKNKSKYAEVRKVIQTSY